MGKLIKWGILGCGDIAHKFASDLKLVEDALLIAVGSRSREKAAAFAATHEVERSYGSYAALVADPDIDVVYIASPHSHHHEHTMLCLNHQKAVLCEKAFAMNNRQAQEMVALARKNKLFLMEALWTKFLPPYKKAMELIANGAIGDVRNMLVNFGFVAATRNVERLTRPELGGGTILDIGVYNTFMVLSVMGRPDRVYATMAPSAEGVDEQCAITFRYLDGRLAQLFSSFTTGLANEADIAGTNGRLRIRNRFHAPAAVIEYHPAGKEPEVVPVEHEAGFGYQYEARHVVDCLQQGLTESPVISHEDTLLLMETLDRIRESAGIVYEADQPNETL
jgi:predicted dehydrogenase